MVPDEISEVTSNHVWNRREFMRTVFTIFGLCLLVTLVASAVELDPSAMLYMPFEEGKGNTTADLSGNGNDGKFVGDVKWGKGMVNGALEFNGSDSFVEIPSHKTLQAESDGWTIGVWVKADPGSGQWARVVDKFYGTGYVVGRRGGDPVMGAEWAGSPNSFATLKPVFDNKWHHIVYTREVEKNANLHKLYMDGEFENQGAGGAVNQKNQETTPVRIGAGDQCCAEGPPADVSYFFKGIIDEVLIVRKTLSEAEIKTLMKEGITLAVQPSGKLATTWATIKAR
jgi:hypothetical protein